MKIEWSPRAERDVTQLRDYIGQDSPFYARQFIERLVVAVERLTEMPYSGRKVPEAGDRDTIRELIFQGYRIIYRIQDTEQRVQVVTVIHGARNLADRESLWQVDSSTAEKNK
jgi:toxin ParE1/3/4